MTAYKPKPIAKAKLLKARKALNRLTNPLPTHPIFTEMKEAFYKYKITPSACAIYCVSRIAFSKYYGKNVWNRAAREFKQICDKSMADSFKKFSRSKAGKEALKRLKKAAVK